MFQRAQAMSNDKGGAAPYEAFHGLYDSGFGFHIDGAGRFIQNEDRSVLQESPRHRDALALAAGKAHATFSHQGFISLRQANDKIVGIGRLGGCYNFCFAGARSGVSNVLSDAGGEQHGLLENQRKLVA